MFAPLAVIAKKLDKASTGMTKLMWTGGKMRYVNSEQRLEHAQKIEAVTWGYWSPRDVSAKVCPNVQRRIELEKISVSCMA
eukprot:1426383-Rhodomonas_salina.2